MRTIVDIVWLFDSLMGYKKKDWSNFQTYLPPLEDELLQIVRSHDDITDDLAAQELLRTDFKDPNYNRFKSKLRNNLFLEIFRFRPSSNTYSSYQRSYYECQKLFAIFNILKGLEYTSLAKPLASKLFTKAEKNYFNEIKLEASRYLHYYYSVIKPRPRQAEKYCQEIDLSLKLVQYEINAERRFYTIISRQILNKENDLGTLHLGISYLEELELISKQNIESSKFYLFYYKLGCLIYEDKGDYRTVLKYARKGYEHFENQDYDHRIAKVVFMRSMGYCYLRLNYLVEAQQVIEKSLQLQVKGRNNWFISKRLLMQLECNEQNYQEAYHHYYELANHRKYSSQDETSRVFYTLCGLYFQFFGLTNRLSLSEKYSRRHINSIFKRLSINSVPNRRIKISLIIAQLLYYIYDRDYDSIESRIYALREFCNRNLMRKSPNFRSNCFIKMLLVIPVNNFNPLATRRKADKFLRRMESVPFTVSEHPSEVEIIPYEHLWKMILEDLQAPKRKRKLAYCMQS